MRLAPKTAIPVRPRAKAFFLLEATVGMGLLGIVFMALYTGLVSTTFSVQMSRENLRATQIMAEKLDTIRLYGWNKIDPTYIDPAPAVPLYSADPFSSQPDSGRVYNVEIDIDPAPIEEVYAKDMRMVTVRLMWQTGRLKRSRTMSTLVSKYGLHRYVY